MKRLPLLKIAGAALLAVPLGYLMSVGTPDALAEGEDPPADFGCAMETPGVFETADGGCKDMATGLVWSWQNGHMGPPTDSPWKWPQAMALAEDLDWAGYSDWRLPTLDEFQSVCTHGGAFHLYGVVDTPLPFFYWTSTDRGSWAWTLDFDGCLAELYKKTGGYAHFFCVREPVGFCGDGNCDPVEDTCNCSEDCGTPPDVETDCSDGFDDDCDALIDCDDSDCDGDPVCSPGACDSDGICELGEDCENCPNDCAGVQTGKPSGRYCCGNGTLEPAEGDGSICDGNP